MDFISSGLVLLRDRRRVGARARRRSPGGRRCPAGRRVGIDALAAAGERGLARPQHPDGARRAAARGLRLPPRGRPTRGQGAAAVRARRLGGRPVHRPAPHALRAAVRGDPAARAARWPAPWPSCSPPTALVFWALADAVSDGRTRARRRHDVPADRRRCQRDRVRRPELGAGRRGGAGRGRAAAARADGGRGCAGAGAPAAPPGCRRRRSGSATSPSATTRATGRCSTTST